MLSLPCSLATNVALPWQLRVGVLNASSKPTENSRQGLYIKILTETGMKTGAISAQVVKDAALAEMDVLVICAGAGTAFKSLGPDSWTKVENFLKAGGGAVGSCAGGYSFVRGPTQVRA